MRQSEQCCDGQEMDFIGFVIYNDRSLPRKGITSKLAEGGPHKIPGATKHRKGMKEKELLTIARKYSNFPLLI